MENQIENNQNLDEEISLIDLFAVLLRYRKLIIIGTLVVTFLAGLYLFVLPKLLPDTDKKTSVVVYDIAVNRLPLTVERQLPNATGNANLVLGKEIEFLENSVFKTAKAVEIDEDCRLVVELPDKTLKTLSSGDVKIKL